MFNALVQIKNWNNFYGIKMNTICVKRTIIRRGKMHMIFSMSLSTDFFQKNTDVNVTISKYKTKSVSK